MFKKISAGIILFSAALLATCGGSATTPSTTNTNPTTAPTRAAEPTVDATQSINDLATSVAVVANPPTRAPNTKITPSPMVNVTRKFHLGSLNGTLLDWQIVPGDGATCPTITDRNLALHIKLENTANKEYWIAQDMAYVFGPDDKPAPTIYDGSVGMGKSGAETALQIPASSSLDEIFCTGLTAGDDPNQMTLVLGSKGYVQVRVPLSQDGPADLGGYIETKTDKTFTYKGAAFSLPAIVVTTGVWSDQSGSGQTNPGKVWLLVKTQVTNQNNPNLFIENGEVSLDANGASIAPALDFAEMYQAAPYGLEQGKNAQGALLFEIPQDTKQVTLALKSSDSKYPDAVSVTLDVPALP